MQFIQEYHFCPHLRSENLLGEWRMSWGEKSPTSPWKEGGLNWNLSSIVLFQFRLNWIGVQPNRYEPINSSQTGLVDLYSPSQSNPVPAYHPPSPSPLLLVPGHPFPAVKLGPVHCPQELLHLLPSCHLRGRPPLPVHGGGVRTAQLYQQDDGVQVAALRSRVQIRGDLLPLASVAANVVVIVINHPLVPRRPPWRPRWHSPVDRTGGTDHARVAIFREAWEEKLALGS